MSQLLGAAVIVPEVIGAALAAEVRAHLAGVGYAPYRLLDRGSYQVCARPDQPALGAALATVAGEVTGRTLAVAEARALRLGPGDYLLAHHDRLHDDHPVELVLDLSAAPVPDAEVHYRRGGRVYFRMPSAPGALAVVERGPSVTCNHTYVSRRQHGAEIVRLVMLLR